MRTGNKYRIKPQTVVLRDGLYFIDEQQYRYRGEPYTWTARVVEVTALLFMGCEVVGVELNGQIEIGTGDFDRVEKILT